jgi:AcrR family transcriptional regulator
MFSTKRSLLAGVGAPEVRPDRRTRKSRAALEGALIELLTTTPFDKITIDDLTATADVARATFYAHYRDKSELLSAATSRIVQELVARLLPLADVSDGRFSGTAMIELFQHADQHRELYRVLTSGTAGAASAELIDVLMRGSETLFTTVTSVLGGSPRVPLPLLTASFVGAAVQSLHIWLEGILPGTAEEIGPLFMRSQIDGLSWSLGLPEGSLTYATAPDRHAEPNAQGQAQPSEAVQSG